MPADFGGIAVYLLSEDESIPDELVRYEWYCLEHWKLESSRRQAAIDHARAFYARLKNFPPGPVS